MKVIGYTVSTTKPRPSFAQTDPKKGDYIRDQEVLDERYYTEAEIDAALSQKADAQSTDNAISNLQVNIDEAVSSINEQLENKANKSEIPSLEGLASTDYVDGKISSIDFPVDSVNGRTGAVTLSASDVGAPTKTYVDEALYGKSNSDHNHDSAYEFKGTVNTALDSAKSYTDTKVSNLASNSSVDTKINTHNSSTSAHNDIRVLISDLTTKLNNFLDVDDTTTDQLSEVLTLINNNKGTLESLTTNKVNISDIIDNLTTNNNKKVLSAAQGVAIKTLIDALQEELNTHGHEIADVNGLQTALNGKAASSHGTHVSYSTTAPVMDGTAAVGTASTVARSDHRHPTDTTRAAKTDFDSHTSNTTVHTNATERTNWNAAYTHTSNKSNPHGVTAAQVGAIPLAGVSDYTITGSLLFADSGTTSGTFRGLQGKCGNNDYWRVGGSQTDNNAGYMEIATCDDGTEPIYVRQYSGVYSTLTRTATLLDGSGNTTFPGSVKVNNAVTLQYDSTNECLNFTFG